MTAQIRAGKSFAASLLPLVLAALGPCSVAEMDSRLGRYSPGPDRLLAVLSALVQDRRVVAADRSETVDGHPARVVVFSLPVLPNHD